MYLFKIGKTISAKNVINESPKDNGYIFYCISHMKMFMRRQDAHVSEHNVRAYAHKSHS